MIIGLTGNDGSGKTTILKKIVAFYMEKGVSVKISGEFEYFFVMRLLKKIIPNTTLDKQQKSLQNRQDAILVRKIMPYIVYADLLSESIYRSIFQKNKIIIKDRTQYDFLATWCEQDVSNRLLTYLYTKLSMLDLHFNIDTNPGIAYKRRVLQGNKTEKDETFYVDKYHIYKKNLKNINSKISIDNNNDLENTVSNITKLIKLRDRFLKINTIAISGPDGAGKTTTINNLEKKLDELNIRYKTIHFYYNYSFLKIKRFFIKDKVIVRQKSYNRSLKNEKRAKQKGKPTWWKWFVLTDAYLQYIIVKVFHRNKLIIFDRFFPDYLVSFDFLGIKYDKNKLLKIFPKVDKYFLQIADYKVLYNRKPEHTTDFFKYCHISYVNLIDDRDMILLDSGKYNEQEIIKELLDNI